jgi:hypothetical protein
MSQYAAVLEFLAAATSPRNRAYKEIKLGDIEEI